MGNTQEKPITGLQFKITITKTYKLQCSIIEENKKKDFKEFIRVLKFTIISISAGLIQIGSFTLMY